MSRPMASGWHDVHETLRDTLAARQALAFRFTAIRSELDALGREADQLWERLDGLLNLCIQIENPGALLQARREAHGLTQQELATKVGVDVGTVSRWERNHLHPRADHAADLADVLGGNPSDYRPLEDP